MSPEVPLLYRIVLAILCFFVFPNEVKSVKNCVGILMGITMNLQIAFGRIAIFIRLIVCVQESGRSFHLLVSPSISFFKDLKFLSNRSFSSLISVSPRYFMLFVAVVDHDVSPISFSASLLFV